MTTIEDLWYGNVRPSENDLVVSSEEKSLIDDMIGKENSLSATLNDEQKMLFQKYISANDKYYQAVECNAFKKGFKLAMKIAVETFK
jgi:hypothetical protein